ENPQLISTIMTPNRSFHCTTHENTLIVTDRNDGIEIYDISDKYHPEYLTSYQVKTSSWVSFAVDDYIYIGTKYSYCSIVDVSDKTNPEYEANFDLYDHQFTSMVFQSNIAHVNSITNYTSQIQTVNLSSITHPIMRGGYCNATGKKEIIVDSNKSYVLCGGSGLYIYDLTSISNPELLSHLQPICFNYSLAVFDDIAYVATTDDIKVIDCSTPTNPVIQNAFNCGWDYVQKLYYYDDYIYGVDRYEGIVFYNVQYNFYLYLSTLFELPGVMQLHFKDNFIYAVRSNDLKIIDISDISNPVIVNTIDIPTSKSFLINDKLFIFEPDWNRIHVYDVSDTQYPQYLGYLPFNYQVCDIQEFLQYTAIMTPYNGIFFFNGLWSLVNSDEFEVPSSLDNCNLSCYPNPFNPSTTITFNVPQTALFATIEIYNIKGQKVRQLVSPQHSAGQHSVTWNGSDENNKPVSSGVYFYKLKVGDETKAVRKCLLLK
ncbi:MAG TPA: FlgD immunoglobulin-like domain containing protein, partial [Candidatus Cloacimonadota bacterium]|nr:FlgD immunoglobulin-like domain containing protein [Candidatus Cloacimonadota bacterium]